MRPRTLVRLAVVPLLASSLSYAEVEPHTVIISVTSAIDGRPIPDASVQVRGKNVGATRIQEPDHGGTLSLTSYGGLELSSGRLAMTMIPGTYTVNVSHPNFRSTGMVMEVPPPGEEGSRRHEIPVVLERNEKLLDHRLTVTVLAPPRGAGPGAAAEPLAGARVRVHWESSMRGKDTEAGGRAVFREPFTIGDMVRIEVTASGYQPAERTMVLGQRQEQPLDAGLTHRTAVEDFLTVTLRPGGGDEAAPSLIIEAARADTGAPVQNATVNIDAIGGPANVASGVTDATGRTAPLPLVARSVGAETHAGYRAKVKAAGFQAKWSDIPAEMVRPGEPRLYAVQLEPETEGGFQLVDVRLEPQILTGAVPQVFPPGQRSFELKGSGPNLDADVRMSVEVPPSIASDTTPITIAAKVQANWRIKAPFFAWLNTGVNVLGRGENRTNGTESQQVGSSSVNAEHTLQTSLKDEFVRRYVENGAEHRQFTISFYGFGTEYGAAVKFTYRGPAVKD